MRVGILGGAFDPIHLGHVAAARAALEGLELDEVLTLPAGDPPYKCCRAGREDRMRMVELACAGIKGLEPCDMEVARPGDTYTVDTLRALTARRPGDQWVYLLGADALDSLDKWRGFDEIVKLTTFAVIGRPGWDRDAAVQKAKALRRRGADIVVTDIEGMDISSGMARQGVAEGRDVADLVGRDVADYIRERGLYLCAMDEPAILERLQRTLTVHRYHHTLGVADTAERLAARFGVDPHRARLAGLLHDCAKSLPYGEMVRLVKAEAPEIDEQELESEPVLHAPAGMALAKRDFGVRDPAILQAIRRHTLGGPDMTAMDALIYVADFIEPGRKPFPGLKEVREAAETDIFEAMRMSAKYSTDYLISRGKQPHPRTISILSGGEAT